VSRAGRMACLLALGLAPAAPAWLAAQQPSVRAALEARGLPADLALAVDSIAARAGANGLPEGPLTDKAVEGWAKHVPAPRIVAAVAAYADRMVEARAAVQGGGVREPDGALISAATEALGAGIGAPSVGTVVRAAPDPSLAAPALTVAAALTAQGLTADQAVTVVADAMRGGRTMAQILDLPSVARAMQDQGMTPAEAGRRILEGGAPTGGVLGPAGGRPGGSPAGPLPPLPRPPRPADHPPHP